MTSVLFSLQNVLFTPLSIRFRASSRKEVLAPDGQQQNEKNPPEDSE